MTPDGDPVTVAELLGAEPPVGAAPRHLLDEEDAFRPGALAAFWFGEETAEPPSVTRERAEPVELAEDDHAALVRPYVLVSVPAQTAPSGPRGAAQEVRDGDAQVITPAQIFARLSGSL